MWAGQRRATRGFLLVSAAAFTVPAVIVGWLGWLLIQSDRELDRQRVQERLTNAAILAIASLEQADAFVAGEQLEFCAEGSRVGPGQLSRLAGSRDRVVRAGALGRMARVARKPHRPTIALQAYDALAALRSTMVLGRPADLVASLGAGKPNSTGSTSIPSPLESADSA